MLYTDDTLMYKPLRSLLDTRAFQQDIDKISNWIKANHLTINVLKTTDFKKNSSLKSPSNSVADL